MHRTLLFSAAFGGALLAGAAVSLAGPADQNPDAVLAQAQQAQQAPGASATQLQPGGSVLSGPGAPTSALQLAPGSAPVDAAPTGRGPPPPGNTAAVPEGSVTGSSEIGPNGAIIPGAEGAGGGTGGSQSNSGG